MLRVMACHFGLCFKQGYGMGVISVFDRLYRFFESLVFHLGLRVAGADRQETARKLGQQLANYGVGRPLFTNAGTDGSVTGPQGNAAIDGSFDADELTVNGDPALAGLTTVSANAVVYPNQGRASATADCPEGARALSGSADLLAFVPRDDIALQSNGRTEHHDGSRDTRWIATWSYDPTAGDFPPARLTVFCVAA